MAGRGNTVFRCLFKTNGISSFQNTGRQCLNGFHSSTARLKGQLIDGKQIAKEIKDDVKSEVIKITEKGLRPPHLTAVIVGDDPASVAYVKNKVQAAKYTGISSASLRLSSTITEKELLAEISTLNQDANVDGILVQLPVPNHINERKVCNAVVPQKDVDGFHVINTGRLFVNQNTFIPATPAAVMHIFKRLNIDTFGKNVVMCGRSKHIGLPIATMLLSDKNYSDIPAGDATVTICHRYTPPEQLKVFTKTADIIITATGVPNLITPDMVKEGVVVVDCGITRIMDEATGKAKLVGDVDFKGVLEKASYITPVPGGVGPLTVAMVMYNTLAAYKKHVVYDDLSL